MSDSIYSVSTAEGVQIETCTKSILFKCYKICINAFFSNCLEDEHSLLLQKYLHSWLGFAFCCISGCLILCHITGTSSKTKPCGTKWKYFQIYSNTSNFKCSVLNLLEVLIISYVIDNQEISCRSLLWFHNMTSWVWYHWRHQKNNKPLVIKVNFMLSFLYYVSFLVCIFYVLS